MVKSDKYSYNAFIQSCRDLMKQHPVWRDAVGIAALSEIGYRLYPQLNPTDFACFELPESLKHAVRQAAGQIENISSDLLSILPEQISADAKAQGVFYTPELIADFICQQTLLNFLGNTTENRVLIRDRQIPSDPSCRRHLLQIFNSVKICDPAVGGGIFLNQMLKLISNIRHILEPELDIAQIRQQIVRNNLYGFDIDPVAVYATVLQLSAVSGDFIADHHIVHADSLLATPRSWQEYFPEVYAEGGFDIIIGNPPYIGEKGHKELFAAVKKSPAGRFYCGKMDYFYFFFHQALDQLKIGGCGAFITTNYFATATNGRNLRDDLKARSTILELINLDRVKVFANAPGQHNLISIFRKGCCAGQDCIIHHPAGLDELLDIPASDVAAYCCSQQELYGQPGNYLKIIPPSAVENTNIFIKLTTDAVKLGDIARITAGIMGGCDSITGKNLNYAASECRCNLDMEKGDGVFVLDSNHVRDRKRIKELSGQVFFRRFYKNSDIRRYHANSTTSLHIIFSTPQHSAAEQQIIQTDLKIYQPILQYIRRLNNENTALWHCLRRGTAHPDIYTGPKIVTPQRSRRNTFAYNNGDWFASADVYFITAAQKGIDLFYLLALLNSKLFYCYFYYYGKRKGSMLEFYSTPLSEVPIKLISPAEQQKFIDLARHISTCKDINPDIDTADDEHALDRMIYDLYGLTAQEIAVVESLWSS